MSGNTSLQLLCVDLARRAKAASRVLALTLPAAKDAFLHSAADLLCGQIDEIVAANDRDLAAAPRYGLSAAQIDRLKLSRSRIEAAAAGLREVAAMPDPIGRVIE